MSGFLAFFGTSKFLLFAIAGLGIALAVLFKPAPFDHRTVFRGWTDAAEHARR